MFRTLLVLSAFLSAAAFSPVRNSRGSALKMSTNVGAIPPLGFFDPLGFSKKASPETMAYYRASEIKHGRVAMLAVLGYVIPEIVRDPYVFSSVPNGLAALDAFPALGWIQIFFFIGALDYSDALSKWDIVGKQLDAADTKSYTEKELSNGRLAMLAIMELMRHDAEKLVGGLHAGDNLITGLPFLY